MENSRNHGSRRLGGSNHRGRHGLGSKSKSLRLGLCIRRRHKGKVLDRPLDESGDLSRVLRAILWLSGKKRIAEHSEGLPFSAAPLVLRARALVQENALGYSGGKG